MKRSSNISNSPCDQAYIVHRTIKWYIIGKMHNTSTKVHKRGDPGLERHVMQNWNFEKVFTFSNLRPNLK